MGYQEVQLECPAIPTIVGSETRFSILMKESKQIKNWPLRYVSCQEVAPPQCRVQWGVNTCGARLDGYKGLRIGGKDDNLEIGFRTTNVSSESRLKAVEEQRVGVATLTLSGQFRLSYWNDHRFPWWPMGGGGDYGDTAGLRIAYQLGKEGFYLDHGWRWKEMSITLRMATGIPDKTSVVTEGASTFYSRVEFPEIDRGDIDIRASLGSRSQQRLDMGIVVDSGAVRNFAQSQVVHKNLGIPEFLKTNHVGVMIYLRLQNF